MSSEIPSDTITGCDTITNFNDILFYEVHTFVLRLYTSNEEISSVNNLRGILAASKTLEKLPPTEYSLKQHCLRAHYQTIIWLNALNPVINPPNVLEYGWQLISGKLVPLFQTLPPFPHDLTILSSCGCKK
ncbi:hypothetical protein NQ314_021293, partial [Rhamnusium bicolor]